MLVIIVVIGTIMVLSVKLIFMAGLLIQQCCETSSVSIGLCRCLDLEKKNSRVFWLRNYRGCADTETRSLAYNKQKNNHNPSVLSSELRLSVQTLYPHVIHTFRRHTEDFGLYWADSLGLTCQIVRNKNACPQAMFKDHFYWWKEIYPLCAW